MIIRIIPFQRIMSLFPRRCFLYETYWVYQDTLTRGPSWSNPPLILTDRTVESPCWDQGILRVNKTQRDIRYIFDTCTFYWTLFDISMGTHLIGSEHNTRPSRRWDLALPNRVTQAASIKILRNVTEKCWLFCSVSLYWFSHLFLFMRFSDAPSEFVVFVLVSLNQFLA